MYIYICMYRSISIFMSICCIYRFVAYGSLRVQGCAGLMLQGLVAKALRPFFEASLHGFHAVVFLAGLGQLISGLGVELRV